jgi:glutathione synthase
LFVADDIATFNPKKDSTLAMIHSVQSKNGTSYITKNKDLRIETKDAVTMAKATVQKITLPNDYENQEKFYTLEPKIDMALTDFDAISQRTDPPVNQAYQYAAFILEKAALAGVIMVNPPVNLLIDNEKILATKFSEFIPPAVFTADTKIIKDFAQKHEKIILKPADGHGGKDIFLSHKQDVNLEPIIDKLSDRGNLQIIAQKFLPEIQDGDKRILIINGEVFPKCIARIPKEHSIRGNLVRGGTDDLRDLTKQDTHIAETVAAYLKKNNIRLAGIDVIGEYLTEINITSPGSLKQIGDKCETKPTNILIEGLIKDIKEKSRSSDIIA